MSDTFLKLVIRNNCTVRIYDYFCTFYLRQKLCLLNLQHHLYKRTTCIFIPISCNSSFSRLFRCTVQIDRIIYTFRFSLLPCVHSKIRTEQSFTLTSSYQMESSVFPIRFNDKNSFTFLKSAII